MKALLYTLAVVGSVIGMLLMAGPSLEALMLVGVFWASFLLTPGLRKEKDGEQRRKSPSCLP